MKRNAEQPAATPRRYWRSAAAILAGFAAVFALSLGTDQALHQLQVYPPWGQPMAHGLYGWALAYRCVYGVGGSYLMARLAPYAPMRHVWIGAAIGFVLSSAGVAAALSSPNLGPVWYPVALALSTLPTAWLGGTLHRPTPGQH
jgi:hypothetical protein